MTKQYHIGVSEGEVAPYVLLPGDPARVEIVASYWDEATLVASNREYITYTGLYKGIPISCTSTGIGAPSTSIAMEELARCGVKTFLRIGTCGTFQDYINNGEIGIFDSAMKYDGASKLYAPVEYPAVANYEVTSAIVSACKKLDFKYHVGTTRTADTFYAEHPRPGSSFNHFWQSNWQQHFNDLKQLNVIGAEMEASIIYTLARAWGLRAGGLAVVLDNLLEVAGETGEFDPEKALDHSDDNISKIARIGSEAIYQMAQIDLQNK